MSDKPETPPARAVETSIQSALIHCVRTAPLPFAITRSPEHTLLYANLAFCNLAGIESSGALGLPIVSFGAVIPGLTAILNRAYQGGVDLLDQSVDIPGRGSGNWQCSVWSVLADDQKTEALGLEFRELAAQDPALELQRQVAERMLLGALRERGLAESAEAARRRAAFLAEAGHMLAQSVDQASTLLALSKLALPELNAWCIVDILHEGGAIVRLGIYHPVREKQKLAKKLETSWYPEPDDAFGAPAMLRAQNSVSIVKDVEVTLAASAHSPENLHILRQLGIGALLTVPLVARSRLLGAITFVSTPRKVSFSAEEIELAEDLASRGALALDNAQVYDIALVLKQSAEAANRAKTAFIGSMSHELRTPLNAIGGYIDLLDMGLRGPVTDMQHADFARVRTNQKHLTVLITEILNFARVASERVTYAIADVDAREAIQRAVDMVEPLFGQRRIAFDGIACDSTIVAQADPERVTQIMVNLLSNAIKYTPSGGNISAECGVEQNFVRMTIADTGRGIPADKHELIFEPFVQMKEGFADRDDGVGLGLAISRDLARAMKGDLTVESIEGKGSRFSLSLPRKI